MSVASGSDFGYDTDDCESVVIGSDESDSGFEFDYKREDVLAGKDEPTIQISFHPLKGIGNLPQIEHDFIIICQSCEFLVHRYLISHHSSYFRALCDERFKEGAAGKVTLDEEHPMVVMHLIRYLYTHDYNPRYSRDMTSWDFLPNPDGPKRPFTIDALVHVAADKYNIVGLEAAARVEIEGQMPMDDDYEVDGKIHLKKLVKNLMAIMPFIWENTADQKDELRKTVLAALTKEDQRLLRFLLEQPGFSNVIQEVPDLAIEIMRSNLPSARRDRR